MKIKSIYLVIGLMLILSACSHVQEPMVEEEHVNNKTTNKETLDVGYELESQEFTDQEKHILIQYPKMTGYKGELLQDYMNQSLAKIVERYSKNESYSDVTLSYEVTRMDEKILSVVYRGKGKFDGSKEFTILKSMNLDIASSNEMNYSNFVTDDETVRSAIEKKAIETGAIEVFEAEGIFLYFEGGNVVFYYMPLDDMVETFIEVPIALDEIQSYIRWDFDEMPVS